MQFVIALPAVEATDRASLERSPLARPMAGVPLIVRTLALARRASADAALVVAPPSIGVEALQGYLAAARPLDGLRVDIVSVGAPLDPGAIDEWRRLEPRLEARFVWMPWDFVSVRKAILPLTLTQAAPGERGARLGPAAWRAPAWLDQPEGVDAPAVVVTATLLAEGRGDLRRYLADRSLPVVAAEPPGGVRVTGAGSRTAERLLILGSGKITDGHHSNFNRRLCRPVVRWLVKTPVTANMVSLAGIPVSVLVALAYAQGYWGAYVVGGLLYFGAVLLDEIDGMVARTKFQESPFGSALEAFVDFISYLFLWSGIAIGLYRQHGGIWLWMGGAILIGTVLSYAMQLHQRKIAAPADRPQDHVKIVYARFEADSGNPISWLSRNLHFLTKKGALCHYAVWFSVLGLLPLFFTLSTIGSNCLWIFGVYANRFFQRA